MTDNKGRWVREGAPSRQEVPKLVPVAPEARTGLLPCKPDRGIPPEPRLLLIVARHDPPPLQFRDRAVRFGKAARNELDGWTVAIERQAIEVIARRRLILVGAREGSRRHADDGDMAGWSGKPVLARDVLMTMQHEFGAVAREDFGEGIGIHEIVPPLRETRQRRMMDENDPRQSFGAEAIENASEPFELSLADAADGIERARGNG